MSVLQPEEVKTSDAPKGPPPSVVTSETEVQAEQTTAAPNGETESGQTTDDSAASDSETQEVKRSRNDRKAQRRIKRLNSNLAREKGKVAELTNKLENLMDEFEELRSRGPDAFKEPELADFDSPQKYAEAYTKWKDNRSPPRRTRQERKPAPPQLDTDELRQFHESGAKKYGDKFKQATADEHMPLSQTMAEQVIGSDIGAELYMYLYEHRDEARAMAGETPAEVGRLIRDLEHQLLDNAKTSPQVEETERDDKGRFKKKHSSNAPPPGPEKEKGTAAPVNLETASMDEYAAYRRKQARESGGFLS